MKKYVNHKKLKYIAYTLLIIIFSLISFISGVYIGEASNQKKIEKHHQTTVTQLKNEIKNLETQLSKNENNSTSLQYNLSNISKLNPIAPSEIQDYESSTNNTKQKKKKITNFLKQKNLNWLLFLMMFHLIMK